MDRCGGLAGPGLNWRRRGAGENGDEWIGQAAPPVHLLHDAEEDLRAGPRHALHAQVQRRDVTLASDRDRECTEVAELVAVFPALVEGSRGENEDVRGRRFGHGQLQGETTALNSNAKPHHRVWAEPRALRRVVKRGQTERGLVAVDGGVEHLSGQGPGLAALRMAADLPAIGTPGFALVFGEVIPPCRGRSKV